MRLALLLLCGAAAGAQTRLTLREAEELALHNHPRIAAAQDRASAAAQSPIQIQANALPQVTGNITGAGALDHSRLAAGGLNNPVIYDRFASGITAYQVLTDFGRNRSLVDSARSRLDAQRQLTEVTRADIVLQVDRAFFSLLRARALLAVAEKTVTARQLVADQIAELARNSLKSTLDVSFSNVALAEAKMLLESQGNAVQSAEANLAAALGAPAQQPYELVDDTPATPLANDLNSLVAQAIAKRPELASLRFEETAAGQLATAESLLSRPTISALASVGVTPFHVAELTNRFAAAGVNVSIPIFNGHAFAARGAEADLLARAARNRVKDAEIQVVRDVRVAFLSALSAYQLIGLSAQLLDQAKLALELSQARYDLGLSSIVELSQAQLSLTGAELSGASARFEFLARRAELSFQLGDNR